MSDNLFRQARPLAFVRTDFGIQLVTSDPSVRVYVNTQAQLIAFRAAIKSDEVLHFAGRTVVNNKGVEVVYWDVAVTDISDDDFAKMLANKPTAGNGFGVSRPSTTLSSTPAPNTEPTAEPSTADAPY